MWKTSVASVELLINNKYDSLIGQGWNPAPFHTRKIKGTMPVKARYHDSYGGVKKLPKCEFTFFDLSWFLSNACVTLLNFKLWSNPSHRQGNVKIKKEQKHQWDAWGNSRLACHQFYFSTLLSFIVLILFPIKCILCIWQYFTWVSCLTMTKFVAYDLNIKPSETFKVDQKRMKCAWLNIHLTLAL